MECHRMGRGLDCACRYRSGPKRRVRGREWSICPEEAKFSPSKRQLTLTLIVSWNSLRKSSLKKTAGSVERRGWTNHENPIALCADQGPALSRAPPHPQLACATRLRSTAFPILALM